METTQSLRHIHLQCVRPDGLVLLHDCLRLLDGRDINELAVEGDGAQPLPLRLFHRFQHALGLHDLRFSGAEDLVGHADLAWVDGPLAVHAEGSPTPALRTVAVRVCNVAEGAVDWPQSVGTRRHHDPGHRVVPRVSPEEVAGLVPVDVGEHAIAGNRAANVGSPRLRRGGVIRDAEVQGLVPLRGAGDLVDVHHAERRLDNQAESDAFLPTDRGFHLAREGVSHVDVFRVADHGDDEHVAALPCLLDDVHDVAVHVVAVEAIDPNSDCFCAEIHFLQRLDDVPARRLLLAHGDGVFKVHHDDVRGRLRRLRDDLALSARDVQLATVQTRRCLFYDGEARPHSSKCDAWVRRPGADRC
mmetsp:Transcript_113882/g.322098  ORF Transcript_113882/g.322098 Transcript_113882/m.322098 type:complete len:358 (-) Transcript_113882:140-1213(-)